MIEQQGEHVWWQYIVYSAIYIVACVVHAFDTRY
jgi:hypothetical protein